MKRELSQIPKVKPKMNTAFTTDKFSMCFNDAKYQNLGVPIMKFIVHILSIALFITLFAAVIPRASSQTSEKPTGGMQTIRFEQDNFKRRYMLYTPAIASKLKSPRPLVLVIHGGGNTDRHMVRLDKKRWNRLADVHGFHVVYPNAVDKFWNFGEGLISNKLDDRVDDLAYFSRVLDDVSSRRRIDKQRIFAVGISQGGQASYYLACNMSERIRAVMPVAMPLPDYMLNECQAGPPVGIAIMNGTADPIVPYDGGWITAFGKKQEIVLSTDDTIAIWRKRNGCIYAPVSTSHVDKPGDKTSVSISEWSECSGAPVKLYKVNNGGHTWPSGKQYLREKRIGKTSRDISAADEGWAFFSQF